MPEYEITVYQHIRYTTTEEADDPKAAVAVIESGAWDDTNNSILDQRIKVEDEEGEVLYDSEQSDAEEYGPFDTGPSTIFLGDYVETDHHGHRGRVTEIHHFCPQGAAWLAGQEIPIPRDLRDRRWISVLCEPAGAVVVPMSLAKVVEPFPFTNSYADTYFRDALPEVSSGTAADSTWTFVGHWENDQIVVEYILDGDVQDVREDVGYWEQGLFAAAASGATQEDALAKVREEYETHDEEGEDIGSIRTSAT